MLAVWILKFVCLVLSFKCLITMCSQVESPLWIFNYFKFLGLHHSKRTKRFTICYQSFILCVALLNYVIAIYSEFVDNNVEFTTKLVDTLDSKRKHYFYILMNNTINFVILLNRIVILVNSGHNSFRSYSDL